MRRIVTVLFAGFILLGTCSTADAGPIRDRLKARFGGGSCAAPGPRTGAADTPPAPPTAITAGYAAPASSCAGGSCAVPSSPRLFAFPRK